MTDLSSFPLDTIKMTAGASGAVVSNLLGIPFDKFRVVVAQDVKSAAPILTHLRATLKTPGAAFTGGIARISMKVGATALNLYVPPQLRESNPFGCAFGVGFCFSPFLNIPRMFQLGKISGDSYPATLRKFFLSPSGWVKYGQNTAMFAPGEGLRMMMCFGTKDWLMPQIGGKEDPLRLPNIPLHCGKMALVAAPIVSVVETVFAVSTETISTIHAKTSAGGTQASSASPKSFPTLLKETITPRYTGRCFTSLCVKNLMANTSLFWVMFMGDFYAKKHTLLYGQ